MEDMAWRYILDTLVTAEAIFGGPTLTYEVEGIFPTNWLEAPISAHVTPMDSAERERVKQIVQKQLDLYPERVLSGNLRNIHLLGKMEFYGVEYGGTYSGYDIYLTSRGIKSGYTDDYLKRLVHHELSSLLWNNHPGLLDQESWKESLPEGFTYQGDGLKAIKAGKFSTEYDTQWHQQGFLSEYGTASLEEDFNLFAEGLFSGELAFWKAVDQYPRLRSKMILTVRFYTRLDGRMTEGFFRGLCKN